MRVLVRAVDVCSRARFLKAQMRQWKRGQQQVDQKWNSSKKDHEVDEQSGHRP